MKKIILVVLGVISMQVIFAQIASNDSSVMLAEEVNAEYMAANVDATAEAEAEPFIFEPPANAREFSCKPRTFTDQTYIKMASKKPNDISLEFYDSSGNKIRAIHFITREGIRLYQGALEPGKYYYNILNGKTYIGYGKFVIQ